MTDALTYLAVWYIAEFFNSFYLMLRSILRNFTITKRVGDELLKFRPFTTAAPLENEEEGSSNLCSTNFVLILIVFLPVFRV